jgi:hypothetical protein
MHEQDARLGRPRDPRRLDIGALADRQHLRPDHPRGVRPQQEGDGDHDVPGARAKEGREHDHEGEERDRERDVGEPHDGGIDEPPK